MLTALNVLQLVLYIALLALLGQGVLYVLAGARREGNAFYKLLQILSRPFTWVVRRITPAQIADRHVPVVTFLLLAVLYAIVTFERADLCVTAKLVGQPGVPLMRLDHTLLRAMALLVFGRQTAALEVFDDMLRRWPDDGYALASRGHLLNEAGRIPEALADLRRVAELQPTSGAAWFNLGFVLETAERWDEALEAFRRATEHGPQLDRAWYGLGLVLIRLQRYDEAVAALKRNTELQPMSPYGWYQLARVHVDRREPEAAIKIIRHLQGFEPKVADQLLRETGLIVGKPAS